jgi:AraC family transcriptional regulator
MQDRLMDPVRKALWYIESHFGGEISLEQIAGVAGVSRFHMSRAFGAVTGQSVMRYVRGRRLTEAARALAAGAPDILAVALEFGYGSHEAFTRAFRDQFGVTPEGLRTQGQVDGLKLVEAINMAQLQDIRLDAPRFEHGRTLLIAGLAGRYSYETGARIPLQWQRFTPHIGNVPGQVGPVGYGVCTNMDDSGNFEYLSGVEVASFDGVPEDLARIRLPARRYVVFTHRGHIADIRATFKAIFGTWLPQSGHEIADAPDFERYDGAFDPRTGRGNVEIWVPLRT